MKLIIVIPDGMCDLTYKELDGKSPAHYANTPGLDTMLKHGSIGLAKTMHNGLPLGSLVGIMGILGYYPPEYVPRGRSIFEAYTLGIQMEPNDLVTRCNIVRVNSNDILEDFTAGQISEADAAAYLQSVSIPPEFELHHDLSYRNVLVHRDCLLHDEQLLLFEPHENMGVSIHEIIPRYQNTIYEPFAKMIMDSRRGEFMLWPWGAGRIRSFPPMKYQSLTITALSFLYGMSTLLGGKAIIPPGATGYRGSNLRAKLDAALTNLDQFDVCLIHCNAPDEEAHIHSVHGKVEAIEQIDAEVIAPLFKYLETYNEPCRVVVLPDHYTVCATGKHLPNLVPYVTFGSGVQPNHSLETYSEEAIIKLNPEVIESHNLIDLHLKS
ncbi:cofactor-independent phosphoglycerate mutase [Chloroflexota bacterium]